VRNANALSGCVGARERPRVIDLVGSTSRSCYRALEALNGRGESARRANQTPPKADHVTVWFDRPAIETGREEGIRREKQARSDVMKKNSAPITLSIARPDQEDAAKDRPDRTIRKEHSPVPVLACFASLVMPFRSRLDARF